MSRLLDPVTRYPGWVLAAVALVTVAAADRIVDFRSGELRIAFDPSTNALLPEGDADRAFYDHVRKLFGSDETILVAFSDQELFTAESLRRIQRIAERIDEIDGVHHTVSLMSALNIRGQDGDLAIEPFVETVPDDPGELAEIRRQALENPIYAGNIVSRDGRTAAVLVYLMQMSESEFLRRGIDRQIREIAQQERGDAQVWITGQAYVKAAMSRTLLADLMRTIPLAALALILVAGLSFRDPVGALVPLAGVGIALIWTLAIFAARGEALNVITVVLPPMILVVGFAYGVHVVAEYHDLLRHEEPEAEPPRRRVGRALRRVALPVLLTAVTTAVGFLSLAISPLMAIREFGLYATAGILITLAVSLTFVPAALCVLPAPRRLRHEGPDDGFGRLARRLADFSVRRRRAILLGATAIAVLSALGVTRIQISTDVVRLFDPESEVRRHFEAINASLEGSDSLYLVLSTDYRDAFKEPVNLRTVESLQEWLVGQPLIGGATSIVDYVKLINRGFHDDDPRYLAIPESKGLVTQLMFFGANDEIENFVDSRWQTVSILVRSRAIGSAELSGLVGAIEARIASLPDHIRGRVTGNSVLINGTSDEIARGQATSLAVAFLIIYGVLCLLFMSFRVGLLALIPNVLPVLVYFGTLGITGVTLNTTTGLVACLVLGIAVDDTIHFLARFNTAAKRTANEAAGVREALWTVGRPVTYTTAALCLGFLAIGTSALQNQREFGVLAAFTLAVAWLVDIVFTPALAARMRVVTLWDVLTLDLGEAPNESIPLFLGLSPHQARIAALMTSIRRFPAGYKLFRTGDAGDDMFVIIHGQLAVTVPVKEGSARIPLLRGEMVGEIGFFHGRRTADVETASECTLLRLTHSNLSRLQRRYPRVGAQIYRNLNHVLADRMARSTERMR
ncbi:MAG: MMPL family transporter [Myxococcota bacterium]